MALWDPHGGERASSHSCPLTSVHMHRQKGVRREGEREKGKGRETISAVLQNKPSRWREYRSSVPFHLFGLSILAP